MDGMDCLGLLIELTQTIHPCTTHKPKTKNTQNEIRSEAHHVTFLKKHLKDFLLALKTANDSSSSDTAAADAAALNGGPQQPQPPQLQQRARGDSVSSVGSLDLGMDLRVTAAEFDALGFLLAGGREGCEGPEAPRLSALVPFWQVGVGGEGMGFGGGLGGSFFVLGSLTDACMCVCRIDLYRID